MTLLTRRSTLAGAGAGMITTALAACSPPNPGEVNDEATIPPTDGPVTLTYWSWYKDLQKVCDIFNGSQDRIRVEVTWIPGGDGGGYAKMQSAVAAGGGPDIGHLDMRSVPEFALAGALVDLSRYGFDEHEAEFLPSAISQVKVADSLWSVPLDTGPLATFYNREALEDELGLEPPETWEQFHETAQEVSEAGKTLMTVDPSSGYGLIAWVMQAGAQWFRPEEGGWTIDMTDDASMRVAEFWDTILKEGILGTNFGPYSTPWYSAAGNGDVLASIGGSWGDALVESVPGGSGKWAVAPMPTWEDGSGYASGVEGTSSAAIMSTSQHPVEALEFLTWLGTAHEALDALIANSGIGWSTQKGYIGEGRSEPSEFFSGQRYNEEVIAPMADGQNLDWTWAPLMQRASAIVSDGMTSAIAGETSLVDVFADTQGQIVEIMRDMGLEAEEAR